MARDSIDAVDVGARLRRAREAAGLTRTDAATDLRVAWTTLVAMSRAGAACEPTSSSIWRDSTARP